MNLFMGLLTDPFITGRGDPFSAGGSPTAYAEESLAYAARGQGRSKSERDAYAAVYGKAPPLAPTFQQRWSVWAAGFGGSQKTSGDPAILGTNDARSSIYGTAASLDPNPANPTLENSGGDVKYETDFRSVYARLLDGWLGANSATVLGADFRAGAPPIV